MIKGLIFYDEPPYQYGIQFMDDLRDAYNPLIYRDVMNGRYSINPYGNIFDHVTCNLISGHERGGYICNSLQLRDGSRCSHSNHRLVATTYCINSNQEEYDIVNHIDANKQNNFHENLEWCTQKHNMQHAYQNGLMVTFGLGEDNPKNVFTNDQVHQICKLMETGMKYADILVECGLDSGLKNQDILTKIRSKHQWRHISDLYNIPEKEARTPQRIYTNEEIHLICQMKSDGYTNREIAKIFNIDMSERNIANKFNRFIMKLKRKEIHTDITSQYNW